ncbi:MAG TPA: biliverdin-producing heme oxygenase [Polyangia bacterium]
MEPAMGGAAAKPSLRDALRAATASRHAALDAAVAFDAATITRAEYGRFVTRLCALVIPLETRLHAIDGFRARLPEAEARRKSAALVADLAVLGHGPRPAVLVQIPRIESEGAAWGCSYVLEGATLGGAVLARQMGPALGLAPGRGLSYWTVYGDQVGALWRSYLAALESWAASAPPREHGEAVEAAVATFDAFLQIFHGKPVVGAGGVAHA